MMTDGTSPQQLQSIERSVLGHNSQQHLQPSGFMQQHLPQEDKLVKDSLSNSTTAGSATSAPLSTQEPSIDGITDPPPCSSNICIRHGCTNPAVSNPEWEEEYCSNECVVRHSRDVFNFWVASNQTPAQNLTTGN